MSKGGKLAWSWILVVGLLHFDFWLWDSTSVVFGFLPTGLAYQMGISVAAAIGWALVVRLDWPEGIEEWAAHEGEDVADAGGAR
jgi:hypothetical protein